MSENPYKRLALRLDALPNGYPATKEGTELRILEKLFTPEEAELTTQLRLTLESPKQFADRIGQDEEDVAKMLKVIAKKGLIQSGRVDDGRGFGLMPFVIGFFEMQNYTMDEELAQMLEDYLHQSAADLMTVEPQLHRVVPVGETVKMDSEIRPYESVAEIVSAASAWAVWDCICRKQKALIGDPCDHPIDNCLVFSEREGAFDNSPVFKALNEEQALATLKQAADDGLIHNVSNSQEGVGHVCNCCTCSCGIMRGMAELGIANTVAISAFINQVEEDICNGCETCIDYCQFDALALEDGVIHITEISCVGCGVCVPSCDTEALGLVRRPEEEIVIPPVSKEDWMKERAVSRGVDIKEVM